MTALLLAALAALAPDPLVPGTPVVLRGHTDAITALAYSPDGALLATASRDKTVRLWKLATGEQLVSLPGAEEQVVSLSFNADGTLLAAGDVALTVRLLSVPKLTMTRALAHPNAILQVALSPDGTLLAVGASADTGGLYTVADGKEVAELRAQSVAFTADGTSLVLGRASGAVELFDVKTKKAKKSHSTKGRAAFTVASADGAVVAYFTGGHRDVVLVNSQKGKALKSLEAPSPKDRFEGSPLGAINGLAVSLDGARVAATADDRQVRVYETKSGALLKAFPLERLAIVALHPDGQSIAVGDGAAIKLWALPAAAAEIPKPSPGKPPKKG